MKKSSSIAKAVMVFKKFLLIMKLMILLVVFCIEHFPTGGAEATASAGSAESAAVSTESAAVCTTGAARAAVATESTTASTVTGRTTVLTTVAAAPWLIGETFGGVELLLTGRECERRLAIYTG